MIITKCKCGATLVRPNSGVVKCGHCLSISYLGNPVPIATAPQLVINFSEGPELWRQAHAYQYTTREAFDEWLEGWCKLVDQLPGCGCSKDFRSVILPQMKEDLAAIDSQESCFAAFWKMHNLVNKKLGKDIVSLEEAISIHAKDELNATQPMEESSRGDRESVSIKRED